MCRGRNGANQLSSYMNQNFLRETTWQTARGLVAGFVAVHKPAINLLGTRFATATGTTAGLKARFCSSKKGGNKTVSLVCSYKKGNSKPGKSWTHSR